MKLQMSCLAAWLVVAGCGTSGPEESSPTGGASTGGSGAAVGTSGAPTGGGGSAAGAATVAGSGAGLGGNNAFGGAAVAGGAGGSAGSVSVGGVSGGGASTAGSAGMAGSGGGTGVAKFHVFLLLGQSNMAGYPKAQAADKTENPRIKVLGFDNCAATGRQTDKWATAVPPLHECGQGAIGPGDYFAKTLIDKLPANDTIGLVPAAISGEKIETFLKVGGAKYSWIINRAKLAQQMGGVIEGILFHQGESNSGDSTWPGKVKTLVTDLKADLGLADIPFLAGELAYDGPCAPHNTQVAKLPGLITNGFVISASGLALDPADTTYHLHFGHDAQVTFGKRYEAKMAEALHL